MKRLLSLLLSGLLVAAMAATALAQSVPERVYGPPVTPPPSQQVIPDAVKEVIERARPTADAPVTPLPPEAKEVVREALSEKGIRDAERVADHWAAASLVTLVDYGLLKGDDNGDLNPDKEMTAAEATTTFLRVLGIEPELGGEGEHWADPALQVAAEAGLVDEQTVQAPDEPMSRLAVAKLLANALGIQPLPFVPAKPFADMEELPAADQALLYALYQAGIFKGFPDGTFKPGEVLTRAQVAILIDRVLGMATR